jgi:hypothetical protein
VNEPERRLGETGVVQPAGGNYEMMRHQAGQRERLTHRLSKVIVEVLSMSLQVMMVDFLLR